MRDVQRGVTVLGVACVVVLFAACSTLSSGSSRGRPRSLLIVGDSVAVQSAQALSHLEPQGTTVTTDAVLGGSAPCDWNVGFTEKDTGKHVSFSAILSQVKPDAVVFLFTGNPGLSGPPAGCVNANSPYSLDQLLATYQPALTTMGDEAVTSGAQVYFEAPPPRNPAVPVGWETAESIHGGYQGAPQIAPFYKELAAKRPGLWHYDPSAGAAVSNAALTWELSQACEPWSAQRCEAGQVQVRTGGTDAVHLDEHGCGAVFLALAVEQHVFGTPRPSNEAIEAAIKSYDGCQ